MSGERALPERPSLRYLQVAARRRHAAGEFASLHAAQLAVAREHGQPSWAALRREIAARDAASGRTAHAVAQLRWIAERFGGAGQPGWSAPGEQELREHFTAPFLAAVPPDRLVATITALGPALRAEPVIAHQTPYTAQGQLGDHLIAVTTETKPPFRISAAQARRFGPGISDPRAAASAAPAAPGVARVAAPTAGAVPEGIAALAEAARARLGMAGLALAGLSGGPAAEPWTVVSGWADLERPAALTAGHAFPVYHVTMAVTAVAVLTLAASRRLRLDEPANSFLGPVRLADDTVTIRELLTHTAGLTDPPAVHAAQVPDLADTLGPVADAGARRGPCSPSYAGYAVLGAVVEHVTGVGYPEAAAQLVLTPLGMHRSWFPARWPGDDAAGPVVTGYDVAPEGAFTRVDGAVCVFPAAGGLWSTAADLTRFGRGWRSLLPAPLADQAVRPHAVTPSGVHAGLGWMVNQAARLTGVFGDGPGGAASLLIGPGGRDVAAAVSNRQTAVEPVSAAVLGVLGHSARG